MTEQAVARLGQLPVGGTLRVELEEPVCLVRVDDRTVKAVHDMCSHEEYSLAEGWVDDNEIECALHGSMFDLDTGEPRSLPAVDPVPVYTARVDDDTVYVDLAAQRNDAAPPRH